MVSEAEFQTARAILRRMLDTQLVPIKPPGKGFPSRVKPVERSDGKVYASISEAARDSDCTKSAISQVCNGRHERTGGYGWKFCT